MDPLTALGIATGVIKLGATLIDTINKAREEGRDLTSDEINQLEAARSLSTASFQAELARRREQGF